MQVGEVSVEGGVGTSCVMISCHGVLLLPALLQRRQQLL